jgi:hypothetical protein
MRLPYQDDLGALRLVYKVLTKWVCLALLDNVSPLRHAPQVGTVVPTDTTNLCLSKHAHIPTHPDGLLFTDDDGEVGS